MLKPKLLVANRGEIAIRIARTAKRLGLTTVAIYSEGDRHADFLRYFDESHCVGPEASRESYLNAEKIIAVARAAKVTHIHPGYGFLSERPHFARACEAAGIIFVGPSAEAMEKMGDKISARNVVDEIGVPRIPGSPGKVNTPEEASEWARKVGYPVLLKASAGGGGKGMRVVLEPAQIESEFAMATREAQNAFGDGSLYVEKYILKPHHLEIQVFGDGKGGATHLGERECSIQRRHQKVFEETPSPLLNRFPETRTRMFECALNLTRFLKYAGAGTLEFIGDETGNFFFLEMNTRLQVEHPVTEWVTGVDLVEWQLQLAMGEWKLPTEPPARKGASAEVRIYAEDPEQFLPSPGPVGFCLWPTGSLIRVDTSLFYKGVVSMSYDPMIAKLSSYGHDRTEALLRLRQAVEECIIEPPKNSKLINQGSLKTNLIFLKRLLRHSALMEGATDTAFIATYPELTQSKTDANADAALVVALLERIL